MLVIGHCTLHKGVLFCEINVIIDFVACLKYYCVIKAIISYKVRDAVVFILMYLNLPLHFLNVLMKIRRYKLL